jgi:hypothetical protein
VTLITGNSCPKCSHLLARLKREGLITFVTLRDYGEMLTDVDGLVFLCEHGLMETHLPVLVAEGEVYRHEAVIVAKIKEKKNGL